MSGKRGRPPLNRDQGNSTLNRDINNACTDPEVIKAAKESLKNLDVLVCGMCLQVFHLIHEFHDHKKSKCSKPKLDPAQFSPSAKIWAFMLWKNSSKTKTDITTGYGDNVVMWKHWSELEETSRKAWMTAGTLLWEVATVQQSNVHASEFEKACARKAGGPSKPPVPLSSVLNDPKLATVATVSLERVSLPVEGESEAAKRAITPELSTRSKRARLTQEEMQEHEVSEPGTPDANSGDEEEEEESQEYVVEAVVGKRFDPITMTNHYEIKWEGFPSSQNTWEPEPNLTHCKAMITEYELKLRTSEASKRPGRSSKTKAMEKVKSWVGSKEPVTNDADFDPDMEIKIEEKDPLEMDDDNNITQGNVGIYNDDFDNVGNAPDDDMDYEPGEAERCDSPELPDQTKKKSPSKEKQSHIRNQTVTPKSVLKPTQIRPAPKKQDPKTATLLVANALGMVRINAKALPNIKSGIYSVQNNEQLGRIKPLVPKVPSTAKSGLVVITSNPKIEKPGVRRKPLTPLVSNKTKITPIAPACTIKTPVQKYQLQLAPSTPTGTKVQMCVPPQKSSVESSLQNSIHKTASSILGTALNVGNQKISFKTPLTNTKTMITLPPNPGKLPFLVMAPPGSGMGALFITPTEDKETDLVKSTSVITNMSTEKDKDKKLEDIQKPGTKDISKVDKEKDTDSSNKGESSKQFNPTSEDASDTSVPESKENESTDDIASMDISMEVTDSDAAKEIDKLINEMTGEERSSEGDPVASTTNMKAPESSKDITESKNKNEASEANEAEVSKNANTGLEEEGSSSTTELSKENPVTAKQISKTGDATEKVKETGVTTEQTKEIGVTKVSTKSPIKTAVNETVSAKASTKNTAIKEVSTKINVSSSECIEEMDIEMEASKDTDDKSLTTSAVTKKDNNKITSKAQETKKGTDKKTIATPEKKYVSPKAKKAVKTTTGSTVVVEKESSSSQEVNLMAPQMITIPDGVDPASLSLPPNMQLMVSDNGEYYIVPQQPEGSTVALAQDPSSGEVKMVAMPGGSEDNEMVVIGSNPNLSQLDLGSGGEDKYFVLMPDGNYMLTN